MQKPEYLYRGIRVDHELLQKLQLYGVDIVPPYEAKIDQYGRETVGDGNEYGVYTTDNLSMVEGAYGSVSMEDGSIIRKDLRINVSGRPYSLRAPGVGIIYEINTNNLDFHIPWISSQLKGHYNNGFQGNEWVIDRVPSSNYKVIKATIGPDLLHTSKNINVSNIIEAQEEIRRIVEERKNQLEILGKELDKLTPLKRLQLDKKDIDLYKDLFGEDGVRYIKSEDISLNNGLDYVRYLLACYYHENTENLNYSTLKYIETLKERLKTNDGINELVDLINSDIMLNNEKRKEFVDRKKTLGETPNTNSFDKKQNMFESVLDTLNKKLSVMYMEEEFGKEKTSSKKNLYRPVISEEVKRIIEKREEIRKLEEQKRIIKYYQEKLEENKLDMEEDNGMSM